MRRAVAIAALLLLSGCGAHAVRVVPPVLHAGGAARAVWGGTVGSSSTPAVGDSLVSTNGQWSGTPTGFTYQWQACDSAGANCVNAAGSPGTNQTYVIASGDCGDTIRSKVTASFTGRGPFTSQSAATNVVSGGCGTAPANTAEPVVTGTVATGSALTTTDGTWSGSPTSFTYQWQRCGTDGTGCANIGSATSSSYTVASADAGHTVEAVVTAHNAAGATAANAPIVPAIDEFNGSSVDTNVWTVYNQQGDESHSPGEPECYLPSQVTESGGNMNELASFSASSFTCPTGTFQTKLSSGLSTGGPVTSLPVNAIPVAAWNAGSVLVESTDGLHSQTFTTSGASQGATSVAVSSQTPNFAYPSGSYVGGPAALNYKSGDIQMKSVNFTYGTVVVRAQVSGVGRTTWPSIWMIGASCQLPVEISAPVCPWSSDAADAAEIDIEEFASTTTPNMNVYNSSSSLSNPCTGTVPAGGNVSTAMHTYELDWTAGSIVFKIDGTTQSGCGITGSAVPSHPMFLLISTQLQPTGAVSSDLPQTTSVDYVRVSH